MLRFGEGGVCSKKMHKKEEEMREEERRVDCQIIN